MRINTSYSHIDICKNALIDENLFNNFKNNNEYKVILEHVSYETGLEYLNKIKTNEYYTNNILEWNKYMENDNIGNPTTFKYDSINISPTTLRYISIGLDIIQHIKNINLNNIDVVEIGGGYGGQCKILFDLCNISNILINKYKIVDIPEVSKFQEKYLNKLLNKSNINKIIFESCLEITTNENYDLCISNYALGEFDEDVREEYIEKVVKYCKHYYIIWNNYGYDEYFNNATIIPETPMTWNQNKIIYN